MQTVTLNENSGQHLFARQMGTGEPVLILHGLLGSSDNWTTIARDLADHYTVFSLDLRNHGRASCQKCPDLPPKGPTIIK